MIQVLEGTETIIDVDGGRYRYVAQEWWQYKMTDNHHTWRLYQIDPKNRDKEFLIAQGIQINNPIASTEGEVETIIRVILCTLRENGKIN